MEMILISGTIFRRNYLFTVSKNVSYFYNHFIINNNFFLNIISIFSNYFSKLSVIQNAKKLHRQILKRYAII